jgi:hypothetical protein
MPTATAANGFQEDSAAGGKYGPSISAAEKAPAEQDNREWADDSVRGGWMTGAKRYNTDGSVADASYSSKYSDKEHLPSFRTDVGAGERL